MKLAYISEVMSRHNYSLNKTMLYQGKIVANIGAYKNGLGHSMHSNKRHLINIIEQGMVILPLDDNNGKILEDLITWKIKEEIYSFRIIKKLFYYQLEINTRDGIIDYRISKAIWKQKWLRENLANQISKQKLADKQK